MNEQTANYDEPWKEALSEYFEAFLSFFFPHIHQLIDWTQPPKSLDKELQQIIISSETPTRIADKLYQVWLLNRQEIWILIHVEVQSQYETEFTQRMYIYNYRAFDLYHKPVVSLAILGDERMHWRPNVYNYTIGGCRVSFEFPIVKLLDYETQWDTLALNTNPFAVIVMAHLKTKATTINPQQREQWKWSLIRGLYDRGKTKEEIIKLFQIIDKMMTLPKQLQQSLNEKIQRFEEERTMPLLSNMEEMAMERGKEMGKEMGKEIGKEIGALQKSHDAVLTVLIARFSQISLEMQDKITQISDLSVLKEVLKLAATVNSLDDFSQFLTNRGKNHAFTE